MPKAKPGEVKTLNKKLALVKPDRDHWWPKSGEHEIAFAFNVYTYELKWFKGDKALGDKWKARFYPFPKWITGTTDWVQNSTNGGVLTVWVDDLKTGKWPVEAAGNYQLMTYGLPFWIKAGMPLDAVIKLSITQWPKYPIPGKPERNWGYCTGLDLALHLQDLRYALEHPEEANPEKELCRFCDSRENCPSFLAAGFDYTRREFYG
jgi:hypothetical protein